MLSCAGCTLCPDPFDYSGPVPDGSPPQNDFRARSGGILPLGAAPKPWPPVVKDAGGAREMPVIGEPELTDPETPVVAESEPATLRQTSVLVDDRDPPGAAVGVAERGGTRRDAAGTPVVPTAVSPAELVPVEVPVEAAASPTGPAAGEPTAAGGGQPPAAGNQTGESREPVQRESAGWRARRRPAG